MSASSGLPAFCVSRRGITISLALLFSIVTLSLLSSYSGYGPDYSSLSSWRSRSSSYGPYDVCTSKPRGAALGIWERAKERHAHLMDDKFTIAIQTYRRPDELAATIKLITDHDIPSLHEIVVVWNDLDTPTPADYTSEKGVRVRYRMSRFNSLNEKLWPDPEYKTKAILLSDDDVHYEPWDLDYVFQVWRRYGTNRLTGAFARCSPKKEDGSLHYSLCAGDNKEPYTMVLTGLTFTHIAFMDYYSSEDEKVTQVREYVDEHFNCEDIGMNFIASMLTCAGPLQVTGYDNAVNTAPPAGISTKPGHLAARDQCLNDFHNLFGDVLVESQEYMQRGMRPG